MEKAADNDGSDDVFSARRLLDQGILVRTLTRNLDTEDPFGVYGGSDYPIQPLSVEGLEVQMVEAGS